MPFRCHGSEVLALESVSQDICNSQLHSANRTCHDPSPGIEGMNGIWLCMRWTFQIREKILLSLPRRTTVLTYAVRSHTPGLKAHHNGCRAIAFTPRCTNRNAISCRRGKAASRFWPGPVQKSSADDAARGHTIGSRLDGEDCSVHRRCWPEIDCQQR
jgi:hypothetical protein